jgi:AraC family transcriptional regulator of adaptative response / DNA-3-methyladenine glycosylase II
LAARIVQRYGTPLATPPQPGLERLFPTPDVLAAADLAGLGVTTARARTIQGIAQALLDGRVTFDQAQSLDEFVQRWTALPGIGAWTAHYIAMRVQNEPDAFPAADLILRRAAAGGGKPLGERALLERAAAWQPWRAYAVMQLWRASGELAKIPPTTRARRSQ